MATLLDGQYSLKEGLSQVAASLDNREPSVHKGILGFFGLKNGTYKSLATCSHDKLQKLDADGRHRQVIITTEKMCFLQDLTGHLLCKNQDKSSTQNWL